MTGRSPDGSGSRPSDRAAAGVSPVPASIPNAAQKLYESRPDRLYTGKTFRGGEEIVRDVRWDELSPARRDEFVQMVQQTAIPYDEGTISRACRALDDVMDEFIDGEGWNDHVRRCVLTVVLELARAAASKRGEA